MEVAVRLGQHRLVAQQQVEVAREQNLLVVVVAQQQVEVAREQDPFVVDRPRVVVDRPRVVVDRPGVVVDRPRVVVEPSVVEVNHRNHCTWRHLMLHSKTVTVDRAREEEDPKVLFLLPTASVSFPLPPV